jgi:hypothetical protein
MLTCQQLLRRSKGKLFVWQSAGKNADLSAAAEKKQRAAVWMADCLAEGSVESRKHVLEK